MVVGILVGFLLFAMVNTAIWLFSKDARYVPASPATVRTMLTMAGATPGRVLYDLGSGDGRLVIMAAREFGCRAVGIEINPLRWLLSRVLVSMSGTGGKARIRRADFFEVDLSEADIVCCYLAPETNVRITRRFRGTLRPGTLIVSYRFPFPDLTPIEQDAEAKVYLYRFENTADVATTP